MKSLRYDGPGHRLLVHGQEVPRGGEFKLPREQARRLLADPHINVTELDTRSIARQPAPVAEPEADPIGEGHPELEPEPDNANKEA